MVEPVFARGERPIWGVAALLLAATDALANRFGAVVVDGEISGFARAASGHCYFNLKDADGRAALVRCAMFRRAAALLDFTPKDGQKVRVHGRIALYEARGELQLVVEGLQRVGSGALYEEFLRLRQRLQAEGLLEGRPRRVCARRPAAIGVVTSAAGAALHDVLTSLQRRAPHVRVVVYPTPVQGVQAPPAIVQALQLAAVRREVDTLLLVRGGGSLEDLWAFNDERVVRAIAASPLPVICGVGHETDLTLADLAADLRAPTPTAAAELATMSRAEALAELSAAADRARQAIRRRLDGCAQQIDVLALKLGRPARAIAQQQQHLLRLAERLQRAVSQATARDTAALPRLAERLRRALAVQRQAHAQRVTALQHRLVALDPARVLQRGYAWVEDGSGRPVVSARALQPGSRVTAVWADGRADADVVALHLDAPPAKAL